MKKTIEVKEKKTEFYCDECGKLIVSMYIRPCAGCNRDICTKCERFYPNIWERTDDDYNPMMCNRCYSLLDKYKKSMDTLCDNFDDEKERLESEWQDECKGE